MSEFCDIPNFAVPIFAVSTVTGNTKYEGEDFKKYDAIKDKMESRYPNGHGINVYYDISSINSIVLYAFSLLYPLIFLE